MLNVVVVLLSNVVVLHFATLKHNFPTNYLNQTDFLFVKHSQGCPKIRKKTKTT